MFKAGCISGHYSRTPPDQREFPWTSLVAGPTNTHSPETPLSREAAPLQCLPLADYHCSPFPPRCHPSGAFGERGTGERNTQSCFPAFIFIGIYSFWFHQVLNQSVMGLIFKCHPLRVVRPHNGIKKKRARGSNLQHY